MRRFSLYIVTILLFGTSLAQAQNSSGLTRTGSIYSFFGAGEPVDIGTIEEESIGIFGYSYRGAGSTGLANPALIGQSVFTAATFNLSALRYNAQDQNSSSSNALINPGSLLISLPLKTSRVGIGAALYPVTQSRFRNFREGSFVDAAGNTVDFSENNQGSGGINKLEASIGFKIAEGLYVGWSPSYVFASSTVENFISTSGGSIGSELVDTRIDGQGFGNRFGLALSRREVFAEDDLLSFGLVTSLPVTVRSKRVREFDKNLGDDFADIVIRDGEGLGSGDIDLPFEIGGGVTYYPGLLTNFSVEAQLQQWNDASFDFDNETEALLKNRFRVGIGGQYHPYRRRSGGFLSRFKYGLGVQYDTGHLNIEGQNIETLLFSAGFGILSTRSRSTIDISFQYGVRGTRNNNLVKEEIIGFKLSLNLTELMFIRPKLQ